MSRIAHIPTNPSDGLMVFFAGHGNWNADNGHYLGLTGKRLYRSEIKSALLAKGCQATFLITDCCASREKPKDKTAPPKTLAVSDGYATDKSPLQIPPNYKYPARNRNDLFTRAQGSVDIHSSSFGQESWYWKRGIFTRCFFTMLRQDPKALDCDSNGTITWREAFAALRHLTQQAATELKIDDQTPIAFSLGTPAPP